MSRPVLERWGRRARELLGIELPLVLGPMAGGPSTPGLVAAVSNAGGLGSHGAGYLTPERLHGDIRAIKELTAKAFAVNLFVPDHPEIDRAQIERAIAVLAPYREELGLGPQTVPERFAEDFDEQLAVVLQEGVPIFTFTFGLLTEAQVEALHRSGALVGGTATTAEEAVALQGTGVDFIAAQGSEAGGHRGSFGQPAGSDLVGLLSLVPLICDSVRLPVVGAGGIYDGRGLGAALVAGACAGQLGTAFLLSPEAGTNAPYRDAIRHAGASDTVITAAFSGRRARGIVNRFARELADWEDRPPYPVLNALTRELRQRGAERSSSELLSLWSGQGVGRCRELPAAELVSVLADEAEAALAGPP